MARIVIVGPSQPSRTPRLVRNADALAAAGHEVVVITPVFETSALIYDAELVRRSAWNYVPVPLLNTQGKIRFLHRFFRRSMYMIFSALPVARMGSLALMYGASKVKCEVKKVEADLYIAQQQAALPIIASIGNIKKRPFACDIEDILTESISEPTRLIAAIENAYLDRAAVISTMSEVASAHLMANIGQKIFVYALHNCPSIIERARVSPPVRELSDRPSIYWFGQTLGPHSLALELIHANAKAGKPFKIALRGRPIFDYVKKIIEAVELTGSYNLVEILPVVEPAEMVYEASKHHVLFGSQPSDQLFNQLAIGNKVFTGIMAGCALLVTETIAHRKLNESLGNCMTLVDHCEDGALANSLSYLAQCPERLFRMRQAAWEAGTVRYNWELESELWSTAINSACKS